MPLIAIASSAGTFLTRDPLDGINGTTTVANPYHYVSNDPLNQVDPLGLRQQDSDFNPCAGPLSPAGEAYCAKHGPPPSTYCQTSVDQCLGLGGQYQGKTLDAMQYQNREHFMTVLRSYIGSEPQLRVRWVESLGGGSTAVAYMDARDFERAYSEVIAAEQAAEPTLKETMVRFAIDAAISGSAAFFCGVSFGFCLVATAALVTGGTFALGHSDYSSGVTSIWQRTSRKRRCLRSPESPADTRSAAKAVLERSSERSRRSIRRGMRPRLP